jgi:hypothetical protein
LQAKIAEHQLEMQRQHLETSFQENTRKEEELAHELEILVKDK